MKGTPEAVVVLSGHEIVAIARGSLAAVLDPHGGHHQGQGELVPGPKRVARSRDGHVQS
jgi:hypothetical protein